MGGRLKHELYVVLGGAAAGAGRGARPGQGALLANSNTEAGLDGELSLPQAKTFLSVSWWNMMASAVAGSALSVVS